MEDVNAGRCLSVDEVTLNTIIRECINDESTSWKIVEQVETTQDMCLFHNRRSNNLALNWCDSHDPR